MLAKRSLVAGHRNDLLLFETVAKVYHPDRKDPMLRFTVPEALTLIEQVSGRSRADF